MSEVEAFPKKDRLTTQGLYADLLGTRGKIPETPDQLRHSFSFPSEVWNTLAEMFSKGAHQKEGEYTWTIVGPGRRNTLLVSPVEKGGAFNAKFRGTLSAQLGISPMLLLVHTHPSMDLNEYPQFPGFSLADIRTFVRFNRLAYMFVVIDKYGVRALCQTAESMRVHPSTFYRAGQLFHKIKDLYKNRIKGNLDRMPEADAGERFRKWLKDSRFDDKIVGELDWAERHAYEKYGLGYYVSKRESSSYSWDRRRFTNKFVKP